MNKAWLAILVTVGFSALGAAGDYFLKLASSQEYPLRTRAFGVGFVVYASTAFGWLFVMRYLKLATISVVYSISMIVILTLLGTFYFGEKLTTSEVIGVLLAIAALVLLVRQA